MSHHQRQALRALGMVCGVSALSWAQPATADTCISRAAGVPGLNGQAPRWMGAAPPPVKTEIDDPRWLGAMRHSFPSAAPQDAELRAIHDGSYLILSFRVLARAGAPLASYDSVYLGFAPNATSEAKLVKLTLTTASTPAAGASGQLNAGYWTRNPATGNWAAVLPPGAPWVEDAYLWADSVNEEWTVNVKANLANLGLSAATPFLSFFATHVQVSTFPPPGTATQFIYPAGLPNFSDANLAPVNPASWTQTTLGTTTSCTDGITLSWNEITTGNTPSNKINSNAPNVFHVNPSWNSELIAADAIQAQMRLAHWGSVADPNAAWSVFATGIKNAADGTITYRCGAAAEPACPANPPTEDPHQCIMVTLSGTNTQPVHFARDSSWNNMNFAPASTFEMPAEINLAGTAPIPGSDGKRDIYLYFKLKNMPTEVTDPVQRKGLPKGLLASERKLVESFKYPSRKNLDEWLKLDRELQGKIPVEIANRVKSDRTVYQALREMRAAYEVHVYYDTGTTVSAKDGSAIKILKSMIPFGHFVYHEGPLQGWFHNIEGVKDETGKPFCLDRIANNWYRGRVNQNGKVTVKTTIVALEPGQSPPPVPKRYCGCGACRVQSTVEQHPAWPAWLALLGLALARPRRKNRS